MLVVWDGKTLSGLFFLLILLIFIGIIANTIFPNLTPIILIVEIVFFLTITLRIVYRFEKAEEREFYQNSTREVQSNEVDNSGVENIKSLDNNTKLKNEIIEIENKINILKTELYEKNQAIDDLKNKIKNLGLGSVNLENEAEIDAYNNIIDSLEDKYKKGIITEEIYLDLKQKYEGKIENLRGIKR